MTRTGKTTRAAFTLMEVLVAILIIFLMMGMLIVGIRYARAAARGTADAQAVNALKIGIVKFNEEFKFWPALVKDQTPLNPVTNLPSVYSVSNAADARALRGDTTDLNLTRFSVYSIAYYLVGGLEVQRIGAAATDPPVDGVAGPGFLTPKRDGTFEKSGRRFDPFFDIGKSSKALFSTDAQQGRVILKDNHDVAFRYYRWLHGNPNNNNIVATPADLNIPDMVGTSDDPSLKAAEFAIVAAGSNGVFGDEALLPTWHPQHLTWAQLAEKVSVSGDASTDTTVQQKVRDAAKADNIVGVGP